MSAILESVLDPQRRAEANAADSVRRQAERSASLKHEIATLRNECVIARRGCFLASALFGDADVLLEYEYAPAEEEDEFGPGYPAQATVVQVFIAGKPVGDVESYIPRFVLDEWESMLVEGKQ